MRLGTKSLLIAWLIMLVPIAAAIWVTFADNGWPRATWGEWLFALFCLAIVALLVWIGERHHDWIYQQRPSGRGRR